MHKVVPFIEAIKKRCECHAMVITMGNTAEGNIARNHYL